MAQAPSPFGPQAIPASGNISFPFFTPSFDVALVASVAISGIALVHGFLVFKTKAKYFGLVVQAAFMFAAGMCARLINISFPEMSTAFLVSTILVMVPGTLVSIGVIFTYTRLMWWITPAEKRNISTLWTPPRATSICIVGAQAACDIVGTLGTGVPIKSPGPRTLAIGAVLEMLVWFTFTMLVVRFTFMSRKWFLPPDVDREGAFQLGLALSACAVLMSARGIMLVFEKDALEGLTLMGKPVSIVTTEEWPMWVGDWLPTFLILVILAVYHPGYYLPKRLTGFRLKTKQLKQEQLLEREGPAASNGWVISSPTPIDQEEKGPRVAYNAR